MDKRPEMCEVCGLDVEPELAVRAEMSVAGAMCPTAMVFHPACYEQASVMWQPDPDSICSNDPDYPQTKQWSTEATADITSTVTATADMENIEA